MPPSSIVRVAAAVRPHYQLAAYGFAAAIPDRLNVTVGYDRGERIRADTNHLPITMRLAEPPEPCDWLQSA
jgi:hypothetical protein